MRTTKNMASVPMKAHPKKKKHNEKTKANSFKNVEPNEAFTPSVGFGMGLAAFMSRKCGSDAGLCKCLLACDALAQSLHPKCESMIDFLENHKLKTVKRKKGKLQMTTGTAWHCFPSMTTKQWKTE